MKLIKLLFLYLILTCTSSVHASKEITENFLQKTNISYTFDRAHDVKNIYNDIRKNYEYFFLTAEKNSIFITDLLRQNPNFNDRIRRNIDFLSYDPATNSNSNETLVFIYHVSSLLNKGIEPILNAFNAIDIQNSTELAIHLFNIWLNELTEILNQKLRNYNLSEKHDHFMINTISMVNTLKNKENALNENALFVKQNTFDFTQYHIEFFGYPSVDFLTAINQLQENHILNADIQNALIVFNQESNGVPVQGYDLTTNTNIKETFIYLWHLCSLTNNINPILESLDKIKQNTTLTNAAVIFSNEWANLLYTHSLSKTKNPLTIQLRKKHIQKNNQWMSDSLALAWADQYPTNHLFNLKTRGFAPDHPFVVNYELNQIDSINGLTLYHHPRPGAGICGYLSSNIEGRSPKECLDLLLQHCNDPYYIDLIFDDIKAVIWQVDIEQPLERQMPASWLGVFLTDIYPNTFDDHPLREYFKNNTYLVRDYLKGVIMGDNFPGVDTTLTYIIHNQNEFTATGIFDALAELGGYDLIIYTSNPNNAYDLNINHYHKSPGATQTLHILHRGGHYDLLFENPFPIESPDIF